MINRIKQWIVRARSLQKINYSLARGGASSALRTIDNCKPASWEFSGFSQNGEDGIIDVLLRHVRNPNRYFVEIGTSDGLENNTSWLALVRRYSGLCIEGNPLKNDCHRNVFTPLNYGLRFLSLFVDGKSIDRLREESRVLDPDVFSLDIDGNDFHIAKLLLDAGFRPRIFVVEYNSAFGPQQSVTIPFRDDFRIGASPAERLYYGCSIMGWRSLFQGLGYRFVTVDQNGVNGFFVDPSAFDPDFLEAIQGLDFSENSSQLSEHRAGWSMQSTLISGRPLLTIE